MPKSVAPGVQCELGQSACGALRDSPEATFSIAPKLTYVGEPDLEEELSILLAVRLPN